MAKNDQNDDSTVTNSYRIGVERTESCKSHVEDDGRCRVGHLIARPVTTTFINLRYMFLIFGVKVFFFFFFLFVVFFFLFVLFFFFFV